MSLLLDALKKAAEQKAKKGKQESSDAPAADPAGADDSTDLESLLERASDSTQTAVGEPRIPLDDGDPSMPLGHGDATDVRDPESLARSALRDDTDIRRPDELADSLGEDHIEFAETMIDEDRDEFAETGRFDDSPRADDSTELSETGEFAETLLDEDRSEFAETGQFAAPAADEDSTELSATGEFGGTLVDEDRGEFADTGRFEQTMVDEELDDFAATLLEGDRDEFDETLLDEDRDDPAATMLDEDRTEIGAPEVSPADDQDEFGETTQFVDPATGETTEFGEAMADEDAALDEEPTEFGQTMVEDRTESGAPAEFVETLSADATDLRERTDFGESPDHGGAATGETTEFGIPDPATDAVDNTDYTVHFEDDHDLADEDSTEYTEHGLADVTGFEASHGADDATGITRPPSAADPTDIRAPSATLADLERRDGDDTTGVGEEDMSLLLVEDSTGLTTRSATDPRGRDEAMRALQGDREADLALVDTTRHQVAVDRARDVESGSRTTTSTDTQTRGRDDTTRRGDRTFTSASTTTYAPDNYDRTLMRLPSSDESKLFAGMKPEGDVVMTPDYAKKVFRSKSTAQRWQHIRTYAAIAIIILFGIGIYGAFEYQGQSESIDASLRPLKRDPMPGLIKPETSDGLANLFANPENTERTIEIIERAGRPESGEIAVDEAPGPVDGAADPATIEAAESPAADPPPAEVQAAPAGDPPRAGTQLAAVDPAPRGSRAAPPRPAERAAQAGGSTLQITTSSRPAERDLLLRAAYRAYQAGDDDEAMRLYNQVLEEDPGNRNALLGRAAINVQNNRTSAAIRDYHRLLEANPKDSLAMTSLLAVSNLSPSETESQLKLMIRDEPDSPYLNFALANNYGAQRRWREAQGHYFIALQNNPGDPNYAYNLAVSLEHIKQPRAALAYYRRALDNFDKGLATFSPDLVRQRVEVLENL